MPPRHNAPGHCLLCDQPVDKSRIRSHFERCLTQHTENTQPVRTFLLEIKAMPYWLAVLARADATLAELDAFLRELWLECCGHLSAFMIAGDQYGSEGFDEDEDEDSCDMEISLQEVLSPGLLFSYDYDFGSSTSLELKVLREEDFRQTQAIKLLARNDAPEIPCQECDQPATKICSECIWSGEGALCDACAPEHDCGEDVLLPVVNSPRCGVCSYTGPA